MEDWQLLCLGIDSGGREIGRYFSEDLGMKIKIASYKDFIKKDNNLLGTDREFLPRAMKFFVGDSPNKTLALYGSGDFHHYTYGLCAVASKRSKEFCYIHFDQHKDDRKKSDYEDIDFGSFVNDIVNDNSNNAKDKILVGYKCSKNGGIFASSRRYLNSKKALSDLEKLLDNTCHDVYTSFDLDVMVWSEIVTNWGNGRLKKGPLLDMVTMIKEKKNIIGGDILGYNPHYPFGRWLNFLIWNRIKKSKLLYKDIAQTILGDSWDSLKKESFK